MYNPKIVNFTTEIETEHLEESSFLYQQRLTLLDNPEIGWREIGDFEERFEAHIDGLVKGKEPALALCRQQALEGDVGELHAALRVFCRQNRHDLMLETLEAFDKANPEALKAASDALNEEIPANWEQPFVKLAEKDLPWLNSLIARLIGYRRLNYGNLLMEMIGKPEAAALPEVIWALGRLGEKKASRLLLERYLAQEDKAVGFASALALLRLGEPQTLTQCLAMAHSHAWPFIILGLGGNASTVRTMLDYATQGEITPEWLLGLGLLGDTSTVDILISALPVDELAESAALALNLITGAEIYEEAFVAETLDEDELFEEEREKLKKGESLPPPGYSINRVTQNPEVWSAWWEENKPRFNPGMRYRTGKPYSPAGLLENLLSPKNPRRLRQLAYEEMVTRYGVDFPFEADMPVKKQKQALGKYMEWMNSQDNRFQAGRWYFGGRLISR